MKRRTGLFFLLLSVLLSACAPFATLTPAAVQPGLGATLGATAAFSVGQGQLQVVPLPYVSVELGRDGLAYGVSAQVALRGYARAELAEGISLMGGASLPGPAFDAALLVDRGSWTFFAKGVYAGIRLLGRDYGLGLWGGGVAYWWPEWGVEVSALGNSSGVLFSISGAYRLQGLQ